MKAQEPLSKKASVYFERARQAYRERETGKALEWLEKAKSCQTGCSAFYLLEADIYRKQGKKAEEVEAVREALELDSLKAYPYYFLVLADDCFERAEYARAEEYYLAYLQRDRYKREEERVKRQLEHCRFAWNALQGRQKQTAELYWQTEDPVYWPSLDVTGRTLLFTRQQGEREDMWMLKDSVCYPLHFAARGNAGSPSLTADGQMMYFSMDAGRNGFDIYVSYRLSDTSWSAPVNLGAPVNTDGWEAQPAISADGTRLYFAAVREGGQGGSDIWYSRLLRREVDGRQRWSQPRCLYFNTPGNEMAPFLYFDNRTLFFASDGYPGMGKKDIYKVDVEEVTPPRHIGITVNTPADELGFMVDAGGKWGYFSSDVSGKRCIYRYRLEDSIACPPAWYIRLRTEEEGGIPVLPESLTLTDVVSGDTLACYTSPYVSENMLACVPMGRLLLVGAMKKGYLYASDTLRVDSAIREYCVGLQPLKTGQRLTLKGIFFDTDSRRLRPESLPGLEQLVAFMRLNPEVKIEISGHTDNTGGEDYNRRLSEGRAFEVYKYLFLKRIGRERMSYKGYGKDRPVAPNDTPEGRAMNRRTEIRVVEGD